MLSHADVHSHANMVLGGNHVDVFNDTGRRAKVSPFTPDYESLTKVTTFDVSIRHDCPLSKETCFLMARNALNVPAMDHNFAPPF